MCSQGRTRKVWLAPALLLALATPALASSPSLQPLQAMIDTLPLSQPADAYGELTYGAGDAIGKDAHLPAWIAGKGRHLPNTAERIAYLEMRNGPDRYMSLVLSDGADALVRAWQDDGAMEVEGADGTPQWWVDLPQQHGTDSRRWRASVSPPHVLMGPADTPIPPAPSAAPSAATVVGTALSAFAALIDADDAPERFFITFGAARPAYLQHAQIHVESSEVPNPLAASVLLATRADGTRRAALVLLWPDGVLSARAMAALERMRDTDGCTYQLLTDKGFHQLRLASTAR